MSAPVNGSPTGRRAPGAPAAVMLTLFLLVGVVALYLRLSGGGVLSASEVDLSVPDWRPDARELAAIEAVTARRLASDQPENAHGQALLETYETFNQTDLLYRSDPRSTALADAKADYEQRALTALKFLGEDAYMGMGTRIAGAYLSALERGDTDKLERLGGTFLTQARLTGLIVGERGLRPGSEHMIPLLFMARWAYAVSERARLDALLSRDEAILLLRWKLTANPLVPPARRLELAEQIRALGSEFPVRRVLAARAADEGDWTSAAGLFAEIARSNPSDRAAQATALYARSRVATPIGAPVTPR